MTGWGGVGAWTGLTWLWIGTGGRLLWTRYWTFGFLKMRGNSWLAENSLAFHERLFYGVNYPSSYFTFYKNTLTKLVHFSNVSYIHVILGFKKWRYWCPNNTSSRICHVTAGCKPEGRRLVVLSVIRFIPNSVETSKVVKSRMGAHRQHAMVSEPCFFYLRRNRVG